MARIRTIQRALHTYRIKCNNPICGIEHTAVVPTPTPRVYRVECPACRWHTPVQKLTVLILYPEVKFCNDNRND